MQEKDKSVLYPLTNPTLPMLPGRVITLYYHQSKQKCTHCNGGPLKRNLMRCTFLSIYCHWWLATLPGKNINWTTYIALGVSKILNFRKFKMQPKIVVMVVLGTPEHLQLSAGWQMLRERRSGAPRKVRVFYERKGPQHTLFCRET